MIGDGAGALILRRFDIDQGEEPHGVELVYYNMRSIGGDTQQFGMYLPVGGSVYPASSENLSKGLQVRRGFAITSLLDIASISMRSCARAVCKINRLSDLFCVLASSGKVELMISIET